MNQVSRWPSPWDVPTYRPLPQAITALWPQRADSSRLQANIEIASLQMQRWQALYRLSVHRVQWRLPFLKNSLAAIAALEPNWDGLDAIPVSKEAVEHGNSILLSLSDLGVEPGTIRPSSAGTLVFEWDLPAGEAQLEIGRSTFGFFTDPHVGEPVLCDGPIEALNFNEIASALSTLAATIAPLSLANLYDFVGRASVHPGDSRANR